MKENKRDRLILNGEVVDDSNSKFKVKVSDTHIVLCTLSGKIRQNSIRILVGDIVSVEIGQYDTALGRIVARIRNK